MNAPVRAVLFDIGGVVVELNDMVGYLKDHGIGDPADFHARWLHCPTVRLYESGGCDTDSFADGVIRDLELDMSPAGFLDAFARWPKGLFPGIKDLIRETRANAVVGCLSNTNSLHWPAFSPELEPDDIFDHQILSFEIGLMKPDAEIYQHAVERLDLPAESILFLDDNPLNVEAARDVGLHAQQVYGTEQARAALVRFDIVAE
ncbi:MAG: HAD family phosphatase [Rhodospirillales bacterium]